MRLARLLKSWRAVTDLSIREAAAEIGISTPTLSRIERGEEMNGDTHLDDGKTVNRCQPTETSLVNASSGFWLLALRIQALPQRMNCGFASVIVAQK